MTAATECDCNFCRVGAHDGFGHDDGDLPRRIQRKRTKGWRMPEGAVYVGRPSLWGNPYQPSDGISYSIPPDRRRQWAVDRYRREMQSLGLLTDYSMVVGDDLWNATDRAIERAGAATMGEYAGVALRGRDLVCWCPLDQPCHADVLLELANA